MKKGRRKSAKLPESVKVALIDALHSHRQGITTFRECIVEVEQITVPLRKDEEEEEKEILVSRIKEACRSGT